MKEANYLEISYLEIGDENRRLLAGTKLGESPVDPQKRIEKGDPQKLAWNP